VVDEGEIPEEFFVEQAPKLDRKSLLASLKDGPIDGATLSNGALTLQIRTK